MNQPTSYDDPTTYLTLSDEMKAAVQAWIAATLVLDNERPSNMSSYGYKHQFADTPNGFYLSNGDMKGALLAAGFTPVNTRGKNWTFNCRYREGKG